VLAAGHPQHDTDLYPELTAMVSGGGPDAPSSREEGVHAAGPPICCDLAATPRRVTARRRVLPELPGAGQERRLPWGLQGGQDMTIGYIGGETKLWTTARSGDGKP